MIFDVTVVCNISFTCRGSHICGMVVLKAENLYKKELCFLVIAMSVGACIDLSMATAHF